MSSDSPSVTWTPYFDGTSMSASTSDLFWSKSNDGGLNRLDDFDSALLTETRDGVASSDASSTSDSECFPTASLHHFPAWSSSGVDLHDDEQGSKHTKASPGDALSPSGLSDRQGDGGLNKDVWFIPSPESGSMPSTLRPSLQRKKRTHFAAAASGQQHMPSSLAFDRDEDDACSPGAPTANFALKSFKSVPNLNGVGRRVSSGYTTRLEDLLAEMGWPKQNDEDVEGFEACDGDSTIVQDSGGEHHQRSGRTMNSHPSAGSLASGMPQHATSSALYQRRAEVRDGVMPVPAPVAVPLKTGEEADGTEQQDTKEAEKEKKVVRSMTHDSLSHLAAQQSSMTHSRSAVMAAQTQRLQHMAAQMINVGSTSSNGSSSATSGNTISLPPSGSLDDSPANGQQLLFASPVGAMDQSPSTLGGGRPNTASSGSNTTELRTPITPFVNLGLSTPAGVGAGVEALNWQAAHNLLFSSPAGVGSTPSSAELAMMQLGKMTKDNGPQPSMTDEYLHTLQNSLGLYNVPATAAVSAAAVVNPAAVLDPTSFSHMFGTQASPATPQSALTSIHPQSAHPSSSQNYHQRLIFPPQQQKVVPVGTSAFGQRPRAGTAMAALGTTSNNTPKHMRSTPNLHLMSPSSSLDGSQHNNSASLTSTPVKGLRKIASNRRLNAVLGGGANTPESPSFGLGNMPTSPVSPSKRRAGGGMLSTSTSMGNLGGGLSSSTSNFEFINYGIEDADELCSAVAPSGSYKIPLKGFGEDGEEDEDEDGETGSAGLAGTDGESSVVAAAAAAVPRSPRRSGAGGPRRARSSTNRSGPRWEDPDAPPVPALGGGFGEHGERHSPDDSTDGPQTRSIKRQKSDASMMLSGRQKSPSMSNLRRHMQ